MNKNVVDTLLMQHSTMIAIITGVEKMAEDVNPPCSDIAAGLRDLGKLLVEHIYMENNFIYKNIFENPRNSDLCVSSAKFFVEEMTSIGEGIVVFLNSYNDEEKIKTGLGEFRIQLREVRKILITRIRLEESGLFKMFDKIS